MYIYIYIYICKYVININYIIYFCKVLIFFFKKIAWNEWYSLLLVLLLVNTA